MPLYPSRTPKELLIHVQIFPGGEMCFDVVFPGFPAPYKVQVSFDYDPNELDPDSRWLVENCYVQLGNGFEWTATDQSPEHLWDSPQEWDNIRTKLLDRPAVILPWR